MSVLSFQERKKILRHVNMLSDIGNLMLSVDSILSDNIMLPANNMLLNSIMLTADNMLSDNIMLLADNMFSDNILFFSFTCNISWSDVNKNENNEPDARKFPVE
jgi:hypothetical protein